MGRVGWTGVFSCLYDAKFLFSCFAVKTALTVALVILVTRPSGQLVVIHRFPKDVCNRSKIFWAQIKGNIGLGSGLTQHFT